MKNEFLVITDLEATCWEEKSIKGGIYQRQNSEMIEIGALKVSLDKERYLEPVKEFDVFVRPVKHPILSDFCKQLTSISQEDVDKGLLLPEAMDLFRNEMFDHPATLFGSWGKYDFNFIIEQCKDKRIACPFDAQKVINLKSLVATIKGWKKRGRSIGRTLEDLNMEFGGTPHRGIDDVKNIRRILLEMRNQLNL